MSETNTIRWRITGIGHFSASGEAIYPVTSGRKQLSHRDHDELNRLLAGESAERLYRALDELVECLTLWEAEGTLPEEWNRPLIEAAVTLREHKQ